MRTRIVNPCVTRLFAFIFCALCVSALCSDSYPVDPAEEPATVVLQYARGNPVSNAKVTIADSKHAATLENGKIDSFGSTIKTDKFGRFTVASGMVKATFVFADKHGFALAKGKDLLNSKVLLVQPWVIITGVRKQFGTELRDENLALIFSTQDSTHGNVHLSCKTKTDRQGSFEFTKVPAAPLELVGFAPFSIPSYSLREIPSPNTLSGPLIVETRGHRLVGSIVRLEVDKGTSLTGKWARLEREETGFESENDKGRWYTVDVLSNDKFQVEMVPSGSYLIKGQNYMNGMPVAKFSGLRVTVPQKSGSEIVDVGSVAVVPGAPEACHLAPPHLTGD